MDIHSNSFFKSHPMRYPYCEPVISGSLNLFPRRCWKSVHVHYANSCTNPIIQHHGIRWGTTPFYI